MYDRYYRAARVDEGGMGTTVQLNDYLTVGMTLGLPALFCFAMYIGLALGPKSKVQGPRSEGESTFVLVEGQREGGQKSEDGRGRTALAAPPTLDFRLWTSDSCAVCRAGAVVLVVGFWFDGGLFKLATGVAFWTLLEMGREG